jgi:hypothetical protein
MENLRHRIEHDLGQSLEGEWGVPFELTSPDGQIQRYSLNQPGEQLVCQALNFSRRENPSTGETMVVDQPVISVRLSSLIRVPSAGETWYIKVFWSRVGLGSDMKYLFSSDRAPEHGTDIGFMRMYLQRIDSDEEPIS